MCGHSFSSWLCTELGVDMPVPVQHTKEIRASHIVIFVLTITTLALGVADKPGSPGNI
jgi:hypothetical protein